MRIFLALAIAASVPGAALAAQIDPRTNVATFTQDNIMTAARATNLQAEALNNGGERAVGITAPNGMKFIAQPTTCQKPNQGDCYALSLFAVFRGWQPSLEQMNYFNKHRSFTKSFIDEDAAVLARYEISDYGIPIGNISSSLANFASVAGQFKQFLDSSGVSATYVPTPDTHILGNAFGDVPRTIEIGEPERASHHPAYINTRSR